MSNRKSYRGLMSLPAFGIYKDSKLVATCRAATKEDAGKLFFKHNLHGDEVKKLT